MADDETEIEAPEIRFGVADRENRRMEVVMANVVVKVILAVISMES